MEKMLDEQSRIPGQESTAANAWDLDSRLELAMDALRPAAPPTPMSRRSRAASGGAFALCRLLLLSPDLLLLDEPTNHLDAESVRLARTLF